MTNASITAQAPSYAPDGSRGYILTITTAATVTGWIRVGDNGRTVYATIDHAAWAPVGTVTAPTELTPGWVAEHAQNILKLL